MSLPRKISLVLLIVLVAMQFIRPARNRNGQVMPADLTKHFSVTTGVGSILKTSCYDCHSNNTNYPWYADIQPIGWLLANHIKDGKADLNFNEFGNYSKRRQLSKLKAISNSIKDGTMPLSSYTFLHRDARLSKENKALVIEWATSTGEGLEIKK